MGFIPQITCRRCGNKFSALRRRCPNCGTRRVQQSSRVPGTTPTAVKGTAANARAADNRKWQLIFGAVLVIAVIAALVVMIAVSLPNADAPATPDKPTPPPVSDAPSPSPSESPTPVVTPTVTEVKIYYYGDLRTEFSCRVGDETPLTAQPYPMNLVNPEIVWTSSDENVMVIESNCSAATINAVGSGVAMITVTCYGASATCRVVVSSR